MENVIKCLTFKLEREKKSLKVVFKKKKKISYFNHQLKFKSRFSETKRQKIYCSEVFFLSPVNSQKFRDYSRANLRHKMYFLIFLLKVQEQMQTCKKNFFQQIYMYIYIYRGRLSSRKKENCRIGIRSTLKKQFCF